ncbi:MAG: glutamate mutase L, partial [Eubacterium sp.]
MKNVLLVDFGSTYTKVTVVDVDERRIIGTNASFTTVETDISDGLKKALAGIEMKNGPLTYHETYACSSAAGGLKMAAIGLVPELTVKASKEASLGAGAKVMKTYAYQLTKSDIKELNKMDVDIILLTGGTDGGNYKTILHNAKMLQQLEKDIPIVVAGNRCCVDECEELLEGKEVYLCENVMPVLGKLNVEPAQSIIREIFLKRIVKAKGLSEATSLVS